MKTPHCDGSRSGCYETLKELRIQNGRWEALKSRIEQEILDLWDTAMDRTVKEMCSEQEALMRVQEIIKKLEEK